MGFFEEKVQNFLSTIPFKNPINGPVEFGFKVPMAGTLIVNRTTT
jgi:hypothetical protein